MERDGAESLAEKESEKNEFGSALFRAATVCKDGPPSNLLVVDWS